MPETVSVGEPILLEETKLVKVTFVDLVGANFVLNNLSFSTEPSAFAVMKDVKPNSFFEPVILHPTETFKGGTVCDVDLHVFFEVVQIKKSDKVFTSPSDFDMFRKRKKKKSFENEFKKI